MFDVITIGTATRDVFLQSALFKILRDPEHLEKIGFKAGEAQCFALGGKVEIQKSVSTTGGGATNAAFTFARQGLKTGTLIKVGNDEAGENIIRELKKEKIRVFDVRDKKFATAHSTILLAPNGERTILVYRGASENLSKKEIFAADFNSKWVYIVPGNISFNIINSSINLLFGKGINIAINPSKKFIERKISGLKNILSKSKVVLLNREEASYLTGVKYKNEKGIFAKLDSVVPGIAVMTEGEKGVLVSDGSRIYRAGIFKQRILADRTGSGDAFGSGFVAGLIQKNEKCEKNLCVASNIEYAIRLGSANATSVIEHIGAKAGILTKKGFEESSKWRKLKTNIIRAN